MKRFHGVSFLAGFALAGLFAGIALDVIDAGWRQTVESYKKIERTLMDRIELRDQQDMATSTVKTILLENPYEGANRAAWIIPGSVVPRTDDGRADAYYGYLASNSPAVITWYRAARDEAPGVLDATMGPLPPAPPAPPTDSTTTARELIEILKAAKGARP